MNVICPKSAFLMALTICPALLAQSADELRLYIGRDACLECHTNGSSAEPCRLHAVPDHATAYDALRRPEARHIAAISGIITPPTESRICLSCHATGADDGPRWWADSFRIGHGVQCEKCHGPGSTHAALYRLPESQRADDEPSHIHSGTRRQCAHCHVEMPSHREVLERGFRLDPADARYRTPVNVAASPDGTRLYTANESGDTVSVIELASGQVSAGIPVGRRPHAVAASPDGQTIYVTSRMSDTLTVIDADDNTVRRTTPVGRGPHGVRVTPDGKRVLVLNTEEDTIAILDARTGAVEKRLVAGRGPWDAALSPDGKRLITTSVWPHHTRFREPPYSELTVVDVARGVVTDRHMIPDANMLQGIAFVPGRNVALFTLCRTKNLVPATRVTQGWVITNGLGILWPNGRVDQILLDAPADYFPDPMDIAVSPDGRYAVVTSGGADQVAVVDVNRLLAFITRASDEERRDRLPNHLGSSEHFVIKRIPVGATPRGLCFAPDGRFVYVTNALDDSVAVLDADTWSVCRTIPLNGPTHLSEIRRGERLFHNAGITFGQQFSCRSCHPNGHMNGLTFDIEADGIGMNPVDNRTLRGIFDTPPFKWEGTNPSLARQCGARFAVFFTRLAPYEPDDLQALVRYMATIERPPNRYRSPDGLTPQQRRGKAVFQRTSRNNRTPLPPAQRCTHCHSGAYLTNRTITDIASTMWFDAEVAVPIDNMFDAAEYGDLGTYYFIDAGMPAVEFDVPHLTNIFNSPPYLHNGAAATLEEIWTRFNMVERHGYTGDLTRRQFNDLIAYLKAL